jgi:hypothetical protein
MRIASVELSKAVAWTNVQSDGALRQFGCMRGQHAVGEGLQFWPARGLGTLPRA